MQKDISIVNGGISECELSPFLDQSDGYNCSSLYSIFPPNPPLFSLSPSSYSTDENTQPIELPPSYSEFLREHQDLVDRRDWCLSHLRKTAKEAQALRQENINLQMTNIELNKRFSLLLKVNSPQSMPVASSRCTRSSPLIDDSRPMSIGEKAARGRHHAWNEIAESPSRGRHVPEKDRVERTDVNRVALPKSISVRSKGYLKAVQTSRVRAPFKTVNEMQRVYIDGGKKQEEPLEVKVYKQGVTKTELCNKWQQTGSCPYGEQCQFAHGIEELRPVIRHPRYKTEVCRMVLNGDPCPYAHRCHFRHSLTDEEKRFSST
ncbi:hypothetical protein LguiA_031619 [Lonicera macranthoides]